MSQVLDSAVAARQSLLGLLEGVNDPDILLRWLSNHCGKNRPFVPVPRPPLLPRQRETFMAVEAFLKEAPDQCEEFIREVRREVGI